MKKHFAITAFLLVILFVFVPAAFAGGMGGGANRPLEGVVYKMMTLRQTRLDWGRSYLQEFGGYYGISREILVPESTPRRATPTCCCATRTARRRAASGRP